MMKNNLLLLTLLMFLYASLIQAQVYTFSKRNATYTNLDNPIVVVDEIWDDFDDQEFSFPFGFDATIFDETVNALSLNEFNGEVLFSSDRLVAVVPLLADYVSRIGINGVESSISYKVDGEDGHRIFKNEWNNIGFHEDSLGTSFVNFQLWIYEENNKIEFHFGPSEINVGFEAIYYDEGPISGLVLLNAQEDLIDGVLMEGAADEPTVVTDVERFEEEGLYLSSQPADGLVYVFSQIGTDIIEGSLELNIDIYPTIVKDNLFIKRAEASGPLYYRIIDASGKVLISKTSLTEDKISIANLAAGPYQIQFLARNNTSKTIQFIKQ